MLKLFLKVITPTLLIMFTKLLKVAPFSRRDHPKPRNPATAQDSREFPSALRIVHAGGMVECHYMAIPAVRILEKYPSYVLAKPEVFKRPWNSVVRPEKILTPGHKFLLIPRGTVKKLRRRIKKPSKELSASFGSQGSVNEVKSEASGSFISGFREISGIKKHVTFVGIDHHVKPRTSSGYSKSNKKGKTTDYGKHKKTSNSESHGGLRQPRNAITVWQPSLSSVSETHGN